MTTANTSLA